MLIKRSELNNLNLYQKDINELVEQGYLEKVRQGWYRVADKDNEKSEAALIAALFPDGVICMYTALFETLQNRGTIYEVNTFSNIIGFDKDRDMQMKWREFIRRLKLPELDFSEVLSLMNGFLSPVWSAMINEDEWLKSWDSKSGSWN